MKNKITIFIYNRKQGKFLLVSDAKHFPPNKKMITITLGGNEKEYALERIIAEIKHKIGLTPDEIFSLNWGSVYHFKGEEFREMNYFACINSDKAEIKKENLEYWWLDIKDFIKYICWNDSRELLRRVLIKAINKELYFEKKERGE